MSDYIQRLKEKKKIPYLDIIKEITITDALRNENEESLMTRILEDVYEVEESLEKCQKKVGMKPKVGLTQDELEELQRKLDELKSDISKKEKEDFKKSVKTLCDIDVFHEHVSMHLPKPTEEKTDTLLQQEAGRLLAYLTKRQDLMKILGSEVKSMKELQESKGWNSSRAKKGRQLFHNMMEMYQELSEVTSGISQITKGLKSLKQASKVAYAKMIFGNFKSIKSKLLDIIENADKLEKELKEFIREGRRSLNNTPDYIDEECEICIKKEESWVDKRSAKKFCDRLRARDARKLHTKMVRSGAMQGLVDQFKDLLSCEISDPEVALPALVCSMTDPQRAENLSSLISQNNFLKDFRRDVLQKFKYDKIPTETKKDCMVCGVKLKDCTF